MLIDVCTDSTVSGRFPVSARVSSVGDGIGLNKLGRSGDREGDVINTTSYRTDTSHGQIAV